MRILMLGMPGCGKDTVGALLSNKLSIPLINVGEILRKISIDSVWYQPIHLAMDKGELAPNQIVGNMLKDLVANSRYGKGYLLSGWLRQISDLNYFNPDLDFVLYLKIGKRTVKKRILYRRICEKCGAIYNLKTKLPKKEGFCDFDGAGLIQRTDDSPSVLKERLKDFELLTLPVIAHFKKEKKLIEVNAEGTPEEILDFIIQKMNIYPKN